MAENTGTIVNYKGEGGTNPDLRLFLAHNTIVNDNASSPAFVRVHAATEVQAFNNLFVGKGTPITLIDPNIPLTEMGDLQTDAPGLVDLAGYDYHLVDGSPAIDAGVAVDPALIPESHYVHPAQLEPRPVVGPPDIGAYEFGVEAGTTGGDTDTGPGTSGPDTTGPATSGPATSGPDTSGPGTSSDSDPTTTNGGTDAATSSATSAAETGTGEPGATNATGSASDTAGSGGGEDGCSCTHDQPGQGARSLLALPLLLLGRRRR